MFFLLELILAFGLLGLANVGLGIRPLWIILGCGSLAIAFWAEAQRQMFLWTAEKSPGTSDSAMLTQATEALDTAEEKYGSQMTPWQLRRHIRRSLSPPPYVIVLSVASASFGYASVGGVLMVIGCLKSG